VLAPDRVGCSDEAPIVVALHVVGVERDESVRGHSMPILIDGSSRSRGEPSSVDLPGGGEQEAIDRRSLPAPLARPFPGLRISVVIPTLNEAQNLALVPPTVPLWVNDVIIVDGRSTDGTTDIARAMWARQRRREDDPRLQIVQQAGRGKGAALRTGFEAANGDIIVMLDADGSTDPQEIPAFVGALIAGADFVKGSRFLQGGGTADMPLYRKLGNLGFVSGVRLLFGGSYTDLCYGYNAFWRRVLPTLGLDSDGFEIETQMNVRALKAGLKVAEVPSFESRRVYGEGRLRTIPDGWRVLKTIIDEVIRGRPEGLVECDGVGDLGRSVPLRPLGAERVPEGPLVIWQTRTEGS
jgi:hypothetical protein